LVTKQITVSAGMVLVIRSSAEPYGVNVGSFAIAASEDDVLILNIANANDPGWVAAPKLRPPYFSTTSFVAIPDL
jgi:hypothetical protein